MDALDLTTTMPRGPREQLAGLAFLPRTIDKLRSEQPGGNTGDYVNRADGMSALMCRLTGIDMDELRTVVASASNDDDVAAWVTEHVPAEKIAAANARMESLDLTHIPEDFQARVREAHPVMAGRPELTHFFDIFEADDATRAV